MTSWCHTASWVFVQLTHWGRVMHICVSKLTMIGSDNGLSPDRRQAIIWTNAGISLIGPLGTNFSEILIEILTFSFKKMRLKVSSAKRRPFCLGLNVLMACCLMAPSHYQNQWWLILNVVMGIHWRTIPLDQETVHNINCYIAFENLNILNYCYNSQGQRVKTSWNVLNGRDHMNVNKPSHLG